MGVIIDGEKSFITTDSIRERLGLSSLEGSIVDESYERPEFLKHCKNKYVIDFQNEVDLARNDNKKYLGFRVDSDFFDNVCDFTMNTHTGYGSLEEVREGFLNYLVYF